MGRVHEDCSSFDYLEFAYFCYNSCYTEIDQRDPAQNLQLLHYLAGNTVGDLFVQFESTVLERIYESYF